MLKGWKDIIESDPIVKGIIYNIKKRLFKSFSNINKIKISFFNLTHF